MVLHTSDTVTPDAYEEKRMNFDAISILYNLIGRCLSLFRVDKVGGKEVNFI